MSRFIRKVDMTGVKVNLTTSDTFYPARTKKELSHASPALN
jgi:hypothetical protein